MLTITLLLLLITYTVYHYVFSSDSIVVVKKKELDSDKGYGVPWVGGFTSSLARRLAPWKSLGRESQYLEESYNKYGKHGQICILPGFFGNHVMLPHTWIPWLAKQPDSVLNAKGAQIDVLEAETTSLCENLLRTATHEDIIRRELKLHLNTLIPEMMDEIQNTVHELLGSESDDFREINLAEMIREIVAKAVNRILVGLPLCRNPTFIKYAKKYVNDIPMCAMFMKLLPPILKRPIGELLALLIRYHYSQCAKLLVPFLTQRIAAWRDNAEELPNDFSTWSVQYAMTRNDEEEKTPNLLSRRIILINFAAIHTTTMTTTNLILDILSNAPEKHCLEDLVTECKASKQKYGETWCKARLADMKVLDSSLRESMRISGIIGKAHCRQVIDPQGVFLPDGTWVSQGAIVCVSGYSMHRDESIYSDPHQFHHDRFIQQQQQSSSEEKDKEEEEGKKKLEAPGKTAATTEPTYAGWGLGRHACPGRFFAIDLMKMIFMHLIENYEIKPLSQRPPNMWVAGTPIPPPNAKIQIRRRRSALQPQKS